MKDEPFHLNDPELENAHRVAYLIAGYIQGTLTSPEQKELDAWVAASDKNVELFEHLTDEKNLQRSLLWYNNLNTEEALKRVKDKSPFFKKRSFSVWAVGIAASLILIAALAFILLRNEDPAPSPPLSGTITPANDIPPGGNRASLTLADGSTLLLDSTADGDLSVASAAAVQKNGNEIVYQSITGSGPYNDIPFHTLSTPTGGQYRLTLPDGTRVWLNAESSLHYPTVFTGSDRTVTLTGEGYFEVAKDRARPFRVRSGDMTVDVLGTHFNINAYGDDRTVRTSLVEGSVRVTAGGQNKTLQPGEEAVIRGNSMHTTKADLRAVTAWKDGRFVFHNTPVTIVARQLERWYGIEIEGEEKASKHFNATISRDEPLSKVLRILEGTGDFHFTLSGKKLLIQP